MGKGALECTVCLNEFEDGKELRLLFHCSHVFHLDRIDAWLASHITSFVYDTNLSEQVIDDNLDLLLVSILVTNAIMSPSLWTS